MRAGVRRRVGGGGGGGRIGDGRDTMNEGVI